MTMQFDTAWTMVQAHRASLLDISRARRIWLAASAVRDLPGEFWECGIYRGGTSYLMHKAAKNTDHPRIVRMFDSFQGLPDPDPAFDLHQRGEFAAPLEQALSIFPKKERAHLRPMPGWIPSTFAGFEETEIAIAHIDLDLYRGMVDAIAFIWPRIVVGGVLIMDDYGQPNTPGATRAINDSFAPHELETYPYQAIARKPIAFSNSYSDK